MGSGPNWHQIVYETLETFTWKISMLTGLKVPSLACKYVFYRPENNAKGDSMELNIEGLGVLSVNGMDKRF